RRHLRRSRTPRRDPQRVAGRSARARSSGARIPPCDRAAVERGRDSRRRRSDPRAARRRIRGGIVPMKRLLLVLLIAFPLLAEEHGTTFALADGTKIYYETTGGGSATPLLVVNGGPGFDHMYLHVSNVWETLGKTRAVVMYDQRGN